MQAPIKKRRKIYYVSGVISLVLFPIICVLYFNKVFRLEKLRSFELSVWTPEYNKTHKEFPIYNSHPKRNYTNIFLTGNAKDDSVKLNYGQLAIRELLQTNDTIGGVHFVFDDSIQYWELIEMIDLCLIEDAKTFSLVDNDFWVYIPNTIIHKNKSKTLPSCGTKINPLSWHCIVTNNEDEIDKWKTELQQYFQPVTQLPIIFVIYLMLVFFAIRKWVRCR